MGKLHSEEGSFPENERTKARVMQRGWREGEKDARRGLVLKREGDRTYSEGSQGQPDNRN